MCFLDTLQITLTLLHSLGMNRVSEQQEGREKEMEMGERATRQWVDGSSGEVK